MNRVILFIFLLWSYCAPAQQRKNGVTVLTKDTLTYEHSALVRLGDNWRFYKGDSIGYALPGFNDSGWVVITANVRIDTGLLHKPGYYSRISWYRLHINVDTSIVNIPLSFYIVGAGAYEIYLDGNKIKNYGVIRPGGRSEFYSPHTPLIFQIKSVGDHVIAIRYANYSTGSIFKNEDVALTGFEIYLGEANAVVFSITGNLIVNTTIFIFLFATFICLSVIHLLLFLYYRSIPSNLYFSIFCLSLATIFFMSYYGDVSSDPGVGLNTNIIVPVSAAVLLFSFSGINNELFSRKKLRFRLIGICCFLILIVSFLKQNFAAAAYFGIAGIVLIEGLVLPVAGIYRKVRGARIVGSGVLFFTFFIIFCFVYGFIHKGLSFSNDGIEVTLFKIFASCAILSIPFSMSIYLSWNFASVNKDMKLHLLEVERLSAQALEQEQEKKRMLESQNEQLEREVTIRTAEVVLQKEKIEKQHDELKIEKKKSDDLLLNILPEEVAEELKEKGYSDAKYFDDVTVLFTDFVDFTKAGETMAPAELVNELNVCFKAFDAIMSKYQIEKIKTIGDAYLAVCGLPVYQHDHAFKTVSAATEIIDFMTERKRSINEKTFEIRIGIHSGSVVAGIVGMKKFAYDIWGDTVNTAARIEQNSLPGKINISESVYDLIKVKFECSYRGKVSAKNKGELNMYFVEGLSKK